MVPECQYSNLCQNFRMHRLQFRDQSSQGKGDEWREVGLSLHLNQIQIGYVFLAVPVKVVGKRVIAPSIYSRLVQQEALHGSGSATIPVTKWMNAYHVEMGHYRTNYWVPRRGCPRVEPLNEF